MRSCFQHSSFGVLTCVVVIITLVPHVAPREVDVAAGSTAILPCSVDIIGNIQVMWLDPKLQPLTLNEKRVTLDRRFSVVRPYLKEWNLKIENVRKADQGNYKCRVDTNPPKETVVALWIKFPPSLVYSSPNQVATKGSNVKLMCNGTGHPIPKISWFKKTVFNKRLDSDKIGEGASWILRNVSSHDAGTYECVADNGVPPVAAKQIKVDIQFLPEVHLPYRSISREEGHDTLLECIIKSNPAGASHWEKDGVKLTTSSKYRVHTWETGTYTFTLGIFIYKLQQNDFGDFKCVSENTFGRVEKTMQIHEWRSTEIRVKQTPKNAISKLGEDVKFNCTVEALTAKNSLTWWRKTVNGKMERIFSSHPGGGHSEASHLPKYDIVGQYNLIVRNISMEDSGTYSCEIKAHQMYSAQLTVVGSPSCHTDYNNTVEGEQTRLNCIMDFSGPALSWDVEWQNGYRRMSSINMDSPQRLNRTVIFPATLRDPVRYICAISSRNPSFYGTCSTEVKVVPSTSAAPHPTPRPVSHHHHMDLATVATIIGAVAGGLVVFFVTIIVLIVSCFKTKIRKLEGRSDGSMNGISPASHILMQKGDVLPSGMSGPAYLWTTRRQSELLDEERRTSVVV